MLPSSQKQTIFQTLVEKNSFRISSQARSKQSYRSWPRRSFFTSLPGDYASPPSAPPGAMEALYACSIGPSSRLLSGSHEFSDGGYPTHLIRYSLRRRLPLCCRISSTSYV